MRLNTQLFEGMIIFVEVVNGGSFTKAADNTQHSTSYISKEIAKLEARLGLRLLNRTTRSLSLTAEGELYFQQCQQIIYDAEQAERLISGAQQNPKGKLRISCPVSFGLSHLQPVIAQFLAQYPDITLDLDLDDRKVDIIAEGFDLVIRGTELLNDSSLISRQFLNSRVLTVATPDYIKRHGMPQKPEDLVNHTVLSYRYLKSPNIWNFIDKAGNEQLIELKSRVITNSPQMQLSLCLASQGIIRMPDFNLGQHLETGELVEIFSDLPYRQVNMYLVYPSRKHMSSKVRCFIDFALAYFSDDSLAH
ncbi:LysR family transcriptional regulator [Algibacillus agarilyticus]|uniref:LysR family transcriptional regulator n=1 Tax=Algibacillus agarilyticus TaxID=2234133 RepID=UPI000DD0B337|nr:LysR family transcriptional regulator [Algibacillus agarilyticus]